MSTCRQTHGGWCVVHSYRYRPEVAAALKQFANNVDGVGIDIAVDLDGTKVAVEAVGPHYLSSANTVSFLWIDGLVARTFRHG